MDLKSMLNDGDAAEDRTKTESPQARRESQAPSASPYAPSAQQYPPPQLPQTPGYPRPAPSQHPNLTPVQTQYQFPQHPVQSPGPPYASRPYDGYTSQTPYPQRPPSISYPHPSQMSKYSHSTSSLSPTPPVTQSPNSMRHQSPVSSRSQPPLSTSSQQHSYHHHRSQPSTPLAPPNHYLSHPPPQGTMEPMQSPYQHQRSYSFASNGHPVASPAPQQYGLGGVVESPSAHTRPLPTQRQSSEFSVRSQPRERSESVSPKTKVMPKPQQVPLPPHVQQQQYGSQPIQHQQQRYQTPLRRESTSGMVGGGGGGEVEERMVGNLHQQQHHGQQQYLQQSQQQQQVSLRRESTSQSQMRYSPPSSLDHTTQQPQPQQQLSHAHPEMHVAQQSLFAPPAPQLDSASEVAHAQAGTSVNAPIVQPQIPHRGPASLDADEVATAVNGTSSSLDDELNVKRNSSMTAKTEIPALDEAPESAPAQPMLKQEESFDKMAMKTMRPPLKRPADSEIEDRPPKQTRRRKYTERPIWARLSRHNPAYAGDDTNGTTTSSAPNFQSDHKPQHQHQHPSPVTHANGPNPHIPDQPPWLHKPPLDLDLVHAQQTLGPWEKSFRWNTPYPGMLKAVQDWLFIELGQLGDVGRDPAEGTIEIEAKFGTLTREGERYRSEVLHPCVLSPAVNGRLGFESSMTESEHKAMNNYLNDSIKLSLQPGRIPMAYNHRHETDSFHTLSPQGLDYLPPALASRTGQKGSHQRPPRLRITHDDKTPGRPVVARIVKLPVANLHIFNPGHNYDCRISINLEVNFASPSMPLESLVLPAEHATNLKEPPEVPRKKNRISYKHLAYSIDLTQVQRQGMEPSHELELEMDSAVLRLEMEKLNRKEGNGFADLVAGFLDNALFLMGQRPRVG